MDFLDKLKLRFIEVPRELKQAKRAAEIQGNYSLAERIAKQCVAKIDKITTPKLAWLFSYTKAKNAYEDYKGINEQERKAEDLTPTPRRRKAA